MQPAARMLLLLVLAGLAMQSCISNRRLVYMQDPSLKPRQAVQFENQRPVYRLQQGDVLNISVRSSQPEVSTMFSSVTPGMMGANFSDPNSQYVNGFSIDDKGEILIPVVGKVTVRGLTVTDAEKLVQQKVNSYLKDATVILKLVSFKITVLGEVKKPGYYYIGNLQANLLEGIGLGGDLTPIGNRQRIKLFRQTTTGTEVVLIDLTDANLIRSPYYYLQPNDVIFVEPLPGQTARLNFTPTAAIIGIITGIVSTTLLIINVSR